MVSSVGTLHSIEDQNPAKSIHLVFYIPFMFFVYCIPRAFSLQDMAPHWCKSIHTVGRIKGRAKKPPSRIPEIRIPPCFFLRLQAAGIPGKALVPPHRITGPASTREDGSLLFMKALPNQISSSYWMKQADSISCMSPRQTIRSRTIMPGS